MSYQYYSDNDYYGDGYTILRRSNPIARKEHTCAYCDVKIQPGERYSLIVGIFDDGFGIQKTHLHGCPEELALMEEKNG